MLAVMTALSPKKQQQSKTDLQTGGWIDRFLPEHVRPYAYLARLDRPIGVWLLLWPGLWGIALAAGGWQGFDRSVLAIAALFGVGAIVMRAAGCVINDIWDRKLDQQVERTRVRPLASGAVSVRQAVIFLAGLLLIGLAILLQLNELTIWLGIAVLPLIAAYPLMKRITWWPQAFLGLTFNFSALMGWTAVTGDFHPAVFLLYVSAMFWTLGYDTIYACQDLEDDALAGIKSTARKFGENVKFWVAGFYAVTMILMIKSLSMLGADLTALMAVIPAAAHLAWQVNKFQRDEPASALAVFKSNHLTGALIFAAFLVI